MFEAVESISTFASRDLACLCRVKSAVLDLAARDARCATVQLSCPLFRCKEAGCGQPVSGLRNPRRYWDEQSAWFSLFKPIGAAVMPGRDPSSNERMAELKTNLIVFLWRWIRYKIASWQMKNVDPMYPDMIKYVNDKNEFESTYGTGW